MFKIYPIVVFVIICLVTSCISTNLKGVKVEYYNSGRLKMFSRVFDSDTIDYVYSFHENGLAYEIETFTGVYRDEYVENRKMVYTSDICLNCDSIYTDSNFTVYRFGHQFSYQWYSNGLPKRTYSFNGENKMLEISFDKDGDTLDIREYYYLEKEISSSEREEMCDLYKKSQSKVSLYISNRYKLGCIKGVKRGWLLSRR